MTLTEQFENAKDDSEQLTEKPSNDTLLKLYALYKQATEGDVSSDPPGNPFDFIGKAKYEAWVGQKGKPKETAMQEYVDLVQYLKSN